MTQNASKQKRAASAHRARLGQAIRNVRTTSGMTQRQVAEETGLTVNYLSLLENGKKGVTSTQLEAIAGAFGLRASFLYALAENPDEAVNDDADHLLRSIQSLINAAIQARR